MNSGRKLMLPAIKVKQEKKKKEEMLQTEYTMYFDGCSKGNPGHAGCGAVVYKNGLEFMSSTLYVGDRSTNNEAEYHGLILGLTQALDIGITRLAVFGDSLIVINQMNKDYKVKNPGLLVLYEEAVELTNRFDYISFTHVYRKDNKRADYLSNEALKLKDEDDDEFYTQENTTKNFNTMNLGSSVIKLDEHGNLILDC